MDINRVIWIVLDSAGMGAIPDAHLYGDHEPNTLGHIAEALPDFRLPNMEMLGLGNIDGMIGFSQLQNPKGSYARLAEKSAGKDTTIGHWEMAGLYIPQPFPVYPNGFGRDVMDPFEKKTGRGTLGNYPSSGLAIIDAFGEEHMKTGDLIIYTSADSVFQIAAHEEIVPIEKLYEFCQTAREILTGENAVARVIARPFIGTPGHFTRTSNRRDFSLAPPRPTVLDHLKEAGYPVAGVGKIEDIFMGQGITYAIHNESNADGMKHTDECFDSFDTGLIFTNLVDFDMKYGHRRDVQGYADALTEFDRWLGGFIGRMKATDALFITADHGCDPTHSGTDHTREYVPLLMYGEAIPTGINFRTRETFADIAQTIARIFNVKPTESGVSLF
jgi:phosphopentomutase